MINLVVFISKQASTTKNCDSMMNIFSFMIMVFYVLTTSFKISSAIDSINVSQPMSDGETLVSKGGKFELGFFSTNNSTRRYLGIWYHNLSIHTVVWVANRANPINNAFGILTLNSTGNLVLSQNGSVVWHTTSDKHAQNPVAVILDTGNLVVRNEGEGEANQEEHLWESFDYPSDTILPMMKSGWDIRNGLERRMTSWKNPEDPSPGEFYRTLVLNAYPEFVFMNGTQRFFRLGPWNGISLSAYPSILAQENIEYVFNKDEVYMMYTMNDTFPKFRAIINQTSYTYEGFTWHQGSQTWRVSFYFPGDKCDTYGLCGPNGNCLPAVDPVCRCLKGFVPKSPKDWDLADWSHGCVRNKTLSCNGKHSDGFIKFTGLKVPETSNTWLDKNIGLKECRVKCLNNCSCTAYTNFDVRGSGSGCVMWFGDLIDIKQFSVSGQDLYVRMSASEIGEEGHNHRKKIIIITVATAAAICGILLACICVLYKRRKTIIDNSKQEESNDTHMVDMDLPLFDLQTIKTATVDFMIGNKIGEGGFGPVFWGKLPDGQEIAVKRLSRTSGQGVTEFINEVRLIVKLQHRNLVRLLGCCIEGQERLLIYEYMPMGSLDSFIFDDTKAKVVQWPRRFHIIGGVARGIMYLHQDSRLRIIHRDLKASNVLLDENLNPKISDFGMARTVGGNLTEGNTNRIVGTYGYMAPEYAADGLFSVKSDVFSFGILVMEIICGRRSKRLYDVDDHLNLVGHAWRKWKEGNALELIDLNIKQSYVESEVLRCLHVSLLCVQQSPEGRPSMASVILMLGSKMELPEPNEPGFVSRNIPVYSNSRSNECSANEVVISLHEAR